MEEVEETVVTNATLEANAELLSNPDDLDTDQLFNNLIEDLYDATLTYD